MERLCWTMMCLVRTPLSAQYVCYFCSGIGRTAVLFGTDAPRLRGRQHKRYLFGQGSIDYAHRDNEQIGIEELIASVQKYKELVKHCLSAKI